jgi:hypothetical protein
LSQQEFFSHQFIALFGIMNELRTVDFSKGYFECDGRKFYVKESLSFVRYKELQKLNMEFGYSSSFQDTFKNIREAWNLLNTLKLGEAAVVLHNLMTGIAKLHDKEDPALRLSALFINEEGEDPTVYDEAMMREKIDCWGKELSVLPFFQLASNLVPGWMPVYKLTIQDGLKEKEKKESSQ